MSDIKAFRDFKNDARVVGFKKFGTGAVRYVENISVGGVFPSENNVGFEGNIKSLELVTVGSSPQLFLAEVKMCGDIFLHSMESVERVIISSRKDISYKSATKSSLPEPSDKEYAKVVSGTGKETKDGGETK